ncbi:uncharacterized protein G2W53_007804 [Senna tora]|uniref:Uncharacterized protein n=1 Tax=Senna tora TaxID=362788 RepID=A0A834X7N5_9FABA|nr:uncharacterized protein G2W53_007804 [Senna tora]
MISRFPLPSSAYVKQHTQCSNRSRFKAQNLVHLDRSKTLVVSTVDMLEKRLLPLTQGSFYGLVLLQNHGSGSWFCSRSSAAAAMVLLQNQFHGLVLL